MVPDAKRWKREEQSRAERETVVMRNRGDVRGRYLGKVVRCRCRAAWNRSQWRHRQSRQGKKKTQGKPNQTDESGRTERQAAWESKPKMRSTPRKDVEATPSFRVPVTNTVPA